MNKSHLIDLVAGELKTSKLQAALLVVEELNYGHPRQVLLQVRVDARDGEADAPVGFPHRLAEPLRN